MRGRVHVMAGEHAAAIEQFRLAAIADPTNATWLVEQGLAERAAGRIEAARLTLRRASRLGAAVPEEADQPGEALAMIDPQPEGELPAEPVGRTPLGHREGGSK